MSKKKVAVIGVKGLPGYGGSARANDHILRRLSDKYDITIYALDTHAKSEDYYGIKQYIFKSYNNKKLSTLSYYIRSLFAVIFLHNHDILHLNHRVSGFLLPFVKFKYKTISSIRGLGYDDDDKWSYIEKKVFNFFQYLSFTLPDIVTTVQKSSVDYIKKYTDKPVFYIPNGVENNYKDFTQVVKKEIITFSAARVIYLKGCHDFLKALNELDYKGRVRIIGDLSHVPSYKDEIINLSKNLDVEFLGLIKEKEILFEKIAESKLFVFPSYTEGMSNMLLEVASLKTPIIASDIQPNKDVFSEKEVTLFKVGNYNDLAGKIEFLLKNRQIAESKCDKAYSKISNEYNWDRLVVEYDKIYKKL